ncbi:hypothetical protein, partial [Klebsiella quasipneumoniae]|uniref:hypothetical protein n=1 Tax=Klebsiella quasipneumoniae TaxID=1463165 RepID=UPI0019402CAA
NIHPPSKYLEPGYSSWAVVVIPEQFSAKLNASLYQGVKPYVNNSILLYVDEGRQVAATNIARKVISSIMTQISHQFSAIFL